MTAHEFEVAAEEELIAFFGGVPVERDVDDGYWCYEVEVAQGARLRFSLNVFERSVQAELAIGKQVLARISQEVATRLRVDGDDLRCEFLGADCRATLLIHSKDSYRFEWSTLEQP